VQTMPWAVVARGDEASFSGDEAAAEAAAAASGTNSTPQYSTFCAQLIANLKMNTVPSLVI
jgi:hypothetical protein